MPLEPLSFLLLLVLGGVVAIDGTSFGQFMVSRPFVAASLAGWLLGQPIQGALIGLVLETFHLAVLPVGAARYPEGGPAAVAASAAFTTSDLQPSTLLLVVIGALMVEWMGGESVRYMRQTNQHLLRLDGRSVPSVRKLERRHRAAIALDFARGMSLVGLGTILLVGVVIFLAPLWALGEPLAELLLVAAVAGMLASTFRVVGARTWFTAAGAAAAGTILLLTA
jgi:mannose/fructose/N-acetylgalactosamine-specific phosphotransferase system component IIC